MSASPISQGTVLRAIGLMSGTSLDGVDAAWIETDGEQVFATGPSLTLPYDATLRADLRLRADCAAQQGLPGGCDRRFENQEPEQITTADGGSGTSCASSRSSFSGVHTG